MQSQQRALAGFLVSLVVLSGCARQPEVTHPSAAPPPSASSTSNNGPLPLVNPPYPGPYKTVEINGVECRQGRDEPGKFGGTLVRALISADPKTFNPWTADDTGARELSGYMFSGLVGVDPYTGELFPDMAASFKVDPDGVTYTTTLRKGLKWSDGQPVTSADVAYTWNTIVAQGYGNSSLRDVTTINGKSPTVTTVDALTNKFVTPKPFAPFARLLGIPIAPKHIMEPITSASDGQAKFHGLWSAANLDPKKLVTLGPFVVSRYVAGQRVEFDRAKNYYVVDKESRTLPYLDHLVYQIVPDVNTNLLKFRGGELDLSGMRARDVVDLLKAQQAENFKLYNLGQGIGTNFLVFNLNQRKSPKSGKPYVDPMKSKWFNDVNFRQAINHAINRDTIVANYFRGIGFPLFTAEPPSSPWINKSLKPFSQDLKYSMSLLDKSGFKRKADGRLYDKDNNLVEFNMLTSAGSTFYETMGTMIVEDLKKLGMKVNFQPINFNTLGDKIGNSLDWEAVIMSLSPGDPLEPNDGKNVYSSFGRLHLFDQRITDESGKSAINDVRPWEKRLDEVFDQGAQTLDKSKRAALYDEYQQIIYDQAPFIYLVSPMVIVGVRNTLGNYVPTQLSQSSLGLHNLEEIYKK